MANVVELIVTDSDRGNLAVDVDAMVVVLVVVVRIRAALLAVIEPANVVEDVALNQDITGLAVVTYLAVARGGAEPANVAHVIADDLEVVGAVVALDGASAVVPAHAKDVKAF